MDSSSERTAFAAPAKDAMELDTQDHDLLYKLACQCETLFEDILEAVKTETNSMVVKLLSEYQQQFAIWGTHLGVFAERTQSLDTRLRTFPDLQDLVARLLDILCRSLQQCLIDMDNTDTKVDNEKDTQPSTSSSISKATLTAIDDSISRLSRIGVTIRQSNHEKTRARLKNLSTHDSPISVICTNAIEALYPRAHQSLKSRLSKSMADVYNKMEVLRSRNQKLATRRAPETKKLEPISELTDFEQDIGPQMKITPISNIAQPRLNIAPEARLSPYSQYSLTSVNIQRIRNRKQLPDEASARPPKTASILVSQTDYPSPPVTKDGLDTFACEWCGQPFNKKTLSNDEWRYAIIFLSFS